MKKSLAKLLLRTDVHEDYSVAEREYLVSKSKIDKVTHEIESYNAQKEKIAKDTEIAENKLSSLLKESRSIDEAIHQRLDDNTQDTYIEAKLQEILEQKQADLTTNGKKLDEVKRQQSQLNVEVQTATQNKQSLEGDIATLEREINDLKIQVKERKDKKQEAIQKLPQRRKIRNNLEDLKDQWDEKLSDFQKRSDSTDKATLQALQKELEGYYMIIDNATKTPAE